MTKQRKSRRRPCCSPGRFPPQTEPREAAKTPVGDFCLLTSYATQRSVKVRVKASLRGKQSRRGPHSYSKASVCERERDISSPDCRHHVVHWCTAGCVLATGTVKPNSNVMRLKRTLRSRYKEQLWTGNKILHIDGKVSSEVMGTGF